MHYSIIMFAFYVILKRLLINLIIKDRSTISLYLHITGYPLHLWYNDTTQLLRTVESTGVHLCEHETVEFVMAVHIHAYPNDILSIWLYLVTLLPVYSTT